ncbi:hypothetical protein C0J52_06857 [Blattella germanica]|nr:hypothetical protein C0J52_06857 [Blattella germanica]
MYVTIWLMSSAFETLNHPYFSSTSTVDVDGDTGSCGKVKINRHGLIHPRISVKMATLTVCIVFMMFLFYIQPTYVTGLWCYHCGVSGEPWDKCEETSEIGECGESDYCSKMLREDGTSVRGCASNQTAVTYRSHDIGCWKTKSGHTDTAVVYTCFCNFDFCNFSPKSVKHLPLLIALSSIFVSL